MATIQSIHSNPGRDGLVQNPNTVGRTDNISSVQVVSCATEMMSMRRLSDRMSEWWYGDNMDSNTPLSVVPSREFGTFTMLVNIGLRVCGGVRRIRGG